jgi:ParB family transcriptional regulator, chromosome partitioning protein
MTQTIPLNKLVPSSRNVRRQSDPAADAELKADIEARGLLQNLIVTALKKPRGRYAVEGGGRRLAALSALAAEDKLPIDFGVPCLILDDIGTNAAEASLAENFQRLALNPADECLAFQHFIEKGSDVAGVAKRFGLTVRFVEGRLRLAALAPVVFEALGRGDITLDIAKAYATTPDQERQAYVFEQMATSYNGAHPDSIRRMMTQATVAASDPRARFVGEDAYVAAGGRVERDLFADDQSTRWLDIALLERLASEKLEAAAALIATETGLGWVRPSLDQHVSWELTEGLQRVTLEAPALTADEEAQVRAIEASASDQIAIIEDEDATDDQRATAEAELERLENAVEAITDKPPVIDEAARPTLGRFLVLGRDGQPRLHEAVYVEKPAAPIEDETGVTAEDGDDSTTGRRGAFTQRLTDELAIQRRDILAVHVAADPDFALDLAIFLMVDRAGYGERNGSSLSARHPSDPIMGFKTPLAPATIAREEAEAALDRSWTEGDSLAARFDMFRALDQEARAAWLGHAVAGTLEASLDVAGASACRFHDHLGSLLGIDTARWWRPTGSNFFDRISKPMMFEALGEVGGPVLATCYMASKKAELAQACERIFAGDFIGEVEVKEAAMAWVPAPMRFAGGSVSADQVVHLDAAAGDPIDPEAAGDSGAAALLEVDADKLEAA